jgi:lipid-binding SYLF domain-containing protein
MRSLMVALAAAVPLATGPMVVAAHRTADLHSDVVETVANVKKTDPGLDKFFSGSAGYAVFPGIAKGGMGIGAAHGDGELYEHGVPVGKCSMTQVNIGLQLGGQVYSEIIFFETRDALESFKSGNFAFAGQASAVALKAGASANAKYENGVVVFTQARGGLMYEASIGGQKFGFHPYKPST